VLRRHVKDESIDLVYLDPPFNSNAGYNVLFAEHGVRAAAQIRAFEDTWQWDESAAAAYHEVVESGGKVSEVMQAFRLFLGDTDMLAYFAMMAPRLVELRRVLKATGSLYLHCDPTASHYLKLLLDAVFGPENFRNEIIWKRGSAHSDSRQGSQHFGRISDTILFYANGDVNTWNPQYVPYDEKYIAENYHRRDADGRVYRIDASGKSSLLWTAEQPEVFALAVDPGYTPARVALVQTLVRQGQTDAALGAAHQTRRPEGGG